MRLQPHHSDFKPMIVAMLAATVLILFWQFFVEVPRRQQLEAEQARMEQARLAQSKKQQQLVGESSPQSALADRQAMLQTAERVRIASNVIHGSINPVGLRFDDITLVDYRETLAPDSEEVVLLAPQNTQAAYFAQIGWLTSDKTFSVPGKETVWQADRETISPAQPVTFTWENPEGITFITKVSLDEHYMFSVEQSVINRAERAVQLRPYALINRMRATETTSMFILHEGAIGVFNELLHEVSYSDLKDEAFKDTVEDAKGWFGLTDKYWLTALVPQVGSTFKASFSHYTSRGYDRYQVDYMAEPMHVQPGGAEHYRSRLFAGAKKVELLDSYAEGMHDQPPIMLFDRAVDFGMLYFLTKPIFLLLNNLYHVVGNFGIAILILTLMIKILLFPLANRSYVMMGHMRRLQPRIKKIQETYSNDRTRMQQEYMKLYREEKVNPASGCLPLLIQFPIFFALYKVLFVTIEMRHAPFFGWIQDLSAPDPSNLFTFFGLLPDTPPSFLHLGVLPLLMGITMFIQMQQQPTPADPMQAKVLQLMPVMFLFIAVNMPAGLVLYWTFSNIFTIIQQAVIYARHGKPVPMQLTAGNKK